MNIRQPRVPMAATAVKKVLPYLKKFHAKYGYMPSYREISNQFDKRSVEWGRMMVIELVKAKLIKTSKRKFRSIKIIE